MYPDLTAAWDSSYTKHQNALFWPNEHLVRFVASRLRRRLTLDRFEEPYDLPVGAKALDLGCGMGRHLAFLTEMGFSAYGIDLSEVAVAHASEWMRRLGINDERVFVGSASSLPWEDGTFDTAVSHAVLDSMPYYEAIAAVKELRRVVKPGGWIYVDLISAENHAAYEEIVTGPHEIGTVQSFFSKAKIEDLFSGFDIRELYLERTHAVIGNRKSSRWHVICC